ncbi:Serine/Threonine kinase domain protein (macronuclear) [Tetrahymena thermophila SB210]|uniref:Serine/Threonine kinase domain protein n=1 Tax=Tetrahymena thermophila (strain SB210) TaxID=312017 RepID=I7MH82_TETTS|nr:Serine/Threonine kinase domain protein [Tetrahymena thermophila SB210]EAR87328.2 Serine/Threonine kinase domain protein [Tetrahymena thermophila SB210]|eukprot:XP_001007573.2 Serine/Threonine kinase domain protein [Tetrahymena thermophila SB210]
MDQTERQNIKYFISQSLNIKQLIYFTQLEKSLYKILQKQIERQINLQEMTELGQKIKQPLDQIQKAVKYIEKQGIIIENGLLGAGGSGFVLKACSEWNEHLAVKLMKYSNLEQFESNKREYDILKKFNSNNITKVYQYFTESHESNEYQFIVMERCVYDLKNYIAKKISSNKLLSHQILYTLCLQLSKGLQELHQKNIIHLDIKPANILLGLDLKWKYADLGVSKVVSEQRQHTKNLIGFTATYSSPEQYQLMTTSATHKVTKSSDVYSLGVVFLQLTGVDVTQKWIIKEKISAHNYDRCLNPYYEEFNNCIIKKMMQHEANDRLQIEEVIDILKRLQKNKNEEPAKIKNSANQIQQDQLEQKEIIKNNREQIIQQIKTQRESNKEQEDGQSDQVKVLKVYKGQKMVKVRPVSTMSLNEIFNIDEKVRIPIQPQIPQSQKQRVYSSKKQLFINHNQNENIESKPYQSDRIRNFSSQPQLQKNQYDNSNIEHRLVVKLPQITPPLRSMDRLPQLSTKDTKKKFIISSLNDLDQFQSSNNLDKKSSNNLPSIDEFKSPQLAQKNQRYVNIMQYLSSDKQQQNQLQELQQYHQKQQYIFVSPDKKSYTKKLFGSGQFSSHFQDQRLNKFENPFNSPFNPF